MVNGGCRRLLQTADPTQPTTTTMAKKVTNMVLKVDLQCPCCYKEVKKILCKFPQIRDRKFDEKGNKVTISVVCCNPEKIRDDLGCKGAKVIKCIKIVEPPKPPTPNPTPTPTPSTPTPTPPTPKPDTGKKTKPTELVMYPCPFPMYPLCYPVPVRTCCGPCSEGHGGGPCYSAYGAPPPPRPCYDGYHGYGYGNDRPCHVTRRDYYFCEENPQACSIM